MLYGKLPCLHKFSVNCSAGRKYFVIYWKGEPSFSTLQGTTSQKSRLKRPFYPRRLNGDFFPILYSTPFLGNLLNTRPFEHPDPPTRISAILVCGTLGVVHIPVYVCDPVSTIPFCYRRFICRLKQPLTSRPIIPIGWLLSSVGRRSSRHFPNLQKSTYG